MERLSYITVLVLQLVLFLDPQTFFLRIILIVLNQRTRDDTAMCSRPLVLLCLSRIRCSTMRHRIGGMDACGDFSKLCSYRAQSDVTQYSKCW